jgi:hypothetical protein
VEGALKIGIKGWNATVPEIFDELVGLIGMLVLVGLMALGFLVVHTLHPR